MRGADSDNDHYLGLFAIGPDAGSAEAGKGRVGLYHLAWSVGTLADLAATADRLRAAGALVGSSDHATSKSLYGVDPDGIEFEVGWFVPRDRVTDEMEGELAIGPQDLAAEIRQWGVGLAGAP